MKSEDNRHRSAHEPPEAHGTGSALSGSDSSGGEGARDDVGAVAAWLSSSAGAGAPIVGRVKGLGRYLEGIVPGGRPSSECAFRLPIQRVASDSAGVPRVFGVVTSGAVHVGDAVRLQPSGRASVVAAIESDGHTSGVARGGSPVALTLADPVQALVGDVLSKADDLAEVADQFEATIAWIGNEHLLPGRPYVLRTLAAGSALVTITEIKYRVDLDRGQRLAANQLAADEIGECNIALNRAMPFDPYLSNRETGSFVLADRETGRTLGVGMLKFALRRAHNIQVQHVTVDRASRASLMRQRPTVIWFTGLSGSGKSTIANLLETRLHALGYFTYLLDGDNVRHGLNKDLGFTEVDRVENIRRVAEVSKLMSEAGLLVLVSFISPFRSERQLARELVGSDEFIEVYVDAPLAVAEARDPKGLYKKARRGELANFTGIDSPYEAPESPELRVDTAACSAREACDLVLGELLRRGVVVEPRAMPESSA